MDSATLDLYFQKLNELILDEDKIVTCSSLAFELKIPLNQARELLSQYVKDYRQLKPSELCPTYLISGILKMDKGLAVRLVKEENLNEIKSLFENVITEIIYSVQKNNSVKSNIINLVDQVKNKDLLADLSFLKIVTGKNCIKRKINQKKVPVPQQQTSKATASNSFFAKAIPKKENDLESVKKDDVSKEKMSSQQKQIKAKTTGGIASFFKKSTVKSSNEKGAASNGVHIDNKIDSHKPQKDIKNEVTNMQTSETMEKCVELKSENIEVSNGNNVERMDIDENKFSEKKNEKKRKNNNKNSDKPSKKRKRIQEVCDSDSSDIFEDDENEDIIGKSDDEPEPPSLPKPTPPPKNKTRKAVDRTFVDEEGFIVTTTEYVYENTSEPEQVEKPSSKIEIPSPKVESKPKALLEKKNSTADSENDTKKTSSKGKKNKNVATGKQPTLMNFFKKV